MRFVARSFSHSSFRYIFIKFFSFQLSGSNVRQFRITGLKVGGAILTFSTTKQNGRLYSDSVRVEVGIAYSQMHFLDFCRVLVVTPGFVVILTFFMLLLLFTQPSGLPTTANQSS